VKCESSMRYIPVFFIKKKNNNKKFVCFTFNSKFTGLFNGVRIRNLMLFCVI